MLQARSEFTPRAYPHLSSLRSLMPPEMLDHINGRDENVYGPPDVRIPSLDPPPGDIDVLSIVERGSDYAPLVVPTAFAFHHADASPGISTSTSIKPGKGISLESREGKLWYIGFLLQSRTCSNVFIYYEVIMMAVAVWYSIPSVAG